MQTYRITLAFLITCSFSLNGMDFIKNWGLPKLITKTSIENVPNLQSTTPQNIVPISVLAASLPKAEIGTQFSKSFVIETPTSTSRIDLIKKWSLPIGLLCLGGGLSYYLHRKLKQTREQLVQSETEVRRHQERASDLNRQLTETQRTLRSTQDQLLQRNQTLSIRTQRVRNLERDYEQTQAIVNSFFQDRLFNDISFLKKMLKKHPHLIHHVEARTDENLIHMALRQNNLDYLEAALALGIDANVPNSRGNTPLIEALISSNIHGMRLLLANNADPEYIPDHLGFNALHLAIITGNVHAVSELLASGAQVDAESPNGESGLSLALIAHPEILHLVQEKTNNQVELFKSLRNKGDPRQKKLLPFHLLDQKKQGAKCPICITPINRLENKKSTLAASSCCKTIFCKSCLNEARNHSKKCPACRKDYHLVDVSPTDEDEYLTEESLASSSSTAWSATDIAPLPLTAYVPPYNATIDYPQPTLPQFFMFGRPGFDNLPYLPCHDQEGYITHCVTIAHHGSSIALCHIKPEDHPNFYIAGFGQDNTPHIGMIRFNKLWDFHTNPAKVFPSYKGAYQLIDCFPELIKEHTDFFYQFALKARRIASKPEMVSAQLQCLEPVEFHPSSVTSIIQDYNRRVVKPSYRAPYAQFLHALNLFFDHTGEFRGLPLQLKQLLASPITKLQEQLRAIIFRTDGTYKGLLDKDDQELWSELIRKFIEKRVYCPNRQHFKRIVENKYYAIVGKIGSSYYSHGSYKRRMDHTFFQELSTLYDTSIHTNEHSRSGASSSSTSN